MIGIEPLGEQCAVIVGHDWGSAIAANSAPSGLVAPADAIAMAGVRASCLACNRLAAPVEGRDALSES
ncbi:hypothetical protein AAW14_01200 [Streptomyces hygroscopicus]|uniref:hypothetical protein n=1 Tax=Streptomyces hygroscopicus TaxID=1912 RepID=UPI00223ED73C|nr:hypothetical protein [Streptomyces hygroscopicus]MCW7940681.1 hypothetical protein [Streptomyces hygroscopicus]